MNDLAGGDESSATFVEKVQFSIKQKFTILIDRSTPHVILRWIIFFSMIALYVLRIYILIEYFQPNNGWHIISYGLAIYLLNNFIGFLSPMIDPELDLDESGPILPHASSADETKNLFLHKLPEFKFWYLSTKAVFIAILMTFSSLFDIPVCWPILVVYFISLFILTMKRQINHMIKHKYNPFSFASWNKKRYSSAGKNTAPLPKNNK